ncbi:proline dehydrogenase 2, mitochondrial [Neltuma alba]|uniref:proline dehydrogenase 2, mitochondrial n=1 Tax=Neltuma alba TaxID=207710 RepID=UPI0010A404BE|nr:proline dehydrogenase 2, mitochondrial-like [Prosopis alba]
MATRVIPPRILRKVRYNTASSTKPLNYPQPSLSPAAASAAGAAVEPPVFLERTSSPQKPPAGPLTGESLLNFDDVQRLFSFVPTSKLLRSSAVLHATASESMVDFGMWVMKSKLLEVEPLRNIIFAAVRRTFFDHFCAGEDAATAARSIKGLTDAGLRGMLVYGVEDAHDNDACDRNLNGFLHTVDVSRSLPPSSVSFVIVKITAICPMRLLERVSDLLRWQQKDPSLNLPWKRETLPVFSESSPLYHTQTRPEPLTPEEESDLELAHRRLEELSRRCVQANIPLLVDAEHTTVQPAIDYFTYSSAVEHNRGNNPIIFGTMQTYLKDAKERLLKTTEVADKMGVPMGFKLVRGAYMSTEGRLAESLGQPSPIHNTIEDTHKCFNDCSSLMLERIANGSGAVSGGAVVLATHNVESGKLAAAKAWELGMGKVNHKLEFAQLYGMSEGLSYGLSNAGFQVSKYMPFGPVEMVMPYLLRRAEENRGMLAASGFDRKLMSKELARRLQASVF